MQHWTVKEAQNLGYCISCGLLKPQEKKIVAVSYFPRPTNKIQRYAFLGLVGYHCCFVPFFSSVAAPLSDLTKKGQPEIIQWPTAAEEAFLKLKTALTGESILRNPNFNRSFIVQMDASLLMQVLVC